ncbi:hypothetical protein ACFLU6_11775 [Acidobacteriota bacterium]
MRNRQASLMQGLTTTRLAFLFCAFLAMLSGPADTQEIKLFVTKETDAGQHVDLRWESTGISDFEVTSHLSKDLQDPPTVLSRQSGFYYLHQNVIPLAYDIYYRVEEWRPGVLIADAGPDHIYCGNQWPPANPNWYPQYTADGGIRIGGSPTAQGGSGTYLYTWSPAVDLDDLTVSNPLWTGLMIPGSLPIEMTVSVDDGQNPIEQDTAWLQLDTGVDHCLGFGNWEVCQDPTFCATNLDLENQDCAPWSLHGQRCNVIMFITGSPG